MSKIYLLDANVFIQAKNFHYPFDVFPGFWDLLDENNHNGIVYSIIPIYKEIAKGDDELVTWAKERKNLDWFLPESDETTQQEYTKIANWVMGNSIYTEPAKKEFLEVADSWLIAKAKALGATIVTHERLDSNCKRRVLIPNVCVQFNVEYIKTIELIRETGKKFHFR